jgi:hypothetical protein
MLFFGERMTASQPVSLNDLCKVFSVRSKRSEKNPRFDL